MFKYSIMYKMNNTIQPSILIIGDIMLDHHRTIKVRNIANEAPIPVYQFVSETMSLGGCGNVLKNVHGILVPEKGSAPLSADAVRTSAGALMKIPVCRTQSLYGSIKMLKNSGLKIVGATEKTSEALFDADMSGPVAIVMGDEETGLSTNTWKLCDAHVKIPLSANGVGSLNVSVAAGVITYEVVRQRSK